jgi:hypothetical protein
MNAVQRARKGGEWPDPFVPYTPSTYYIPRATTGGGAYTQLTGGISPNTNCYDHSLGVNGAAGTTGSSWSYGGNNSDAISFMVTNNFGQTGTYAVTGLGLGSFNNLTGYFGNNGAMAIQIVAGTNTNGSGLWYWDLPNNWMIEWRGQQLTAQNGCQISELPLQDTYGNYQNLQFGTWYTALYLWYSSVIFAAASNYSTQGTNMYSTYTQAVPAGIITMNWATPTFSGSGARAVSNGTSVNGGQHQIFRIHF